MTDQAAHEARPSLDDDIDTLWTEHRRLERDLAAERALAEQMREALRRIADKSLCGGCAPIARAALAAASPVERTDGTA